MNNYKKLVSNSIVFAIGNLGSKLIVIFMVPLYTYYLTPSEYGTSDLILSIVGLLTPVITLSIFDAVLRFIMDKSYEKSCVLTNGLIVTIIGNMIFLLLFPVLKYFGIQQEYIIYIVILLFLQSFQSLMSQYTRAVGKVKLYAFNGIFTTLILLIGNILFLVVFHFGLIGYLLSQIVALIASNLFLFIYLKTWKIISIKLFEKELLLEMLMYSLPLMPNALMWWLTNTSNRFIILYFSGVTATGLFAVANKIPSILSIIQNIFFQAWQLSAIETYEQKDRESFYSNVFLYFSFTMIISTSLILLGIKPIFKLFISHSFFEAWKLTPFLLIAVMFSSFSSFVGTNYIASKKTKGILYSTLVGAISNVVLSVLFIQIFGVNGAGIATSISFILMWFYRYIDTQKFIMFKINWSKFGLNMFFLILQIIMFYADNPIIDKRNVCCSASHCNKQFK